MKRSRYLDYAVYGKVIVPMILFDSDSLIRLIEDGESGKCLIVCKYRKHKITR